MISLEEAKLHLRVDHDDEDAAIHSMIATALMATMDYLNWEAKSLLGGGYVPAPIKAAVLLQVGDLYENRERQGDRQLYSNATYERLLNPYRVMEV